MADPLPDNYDDVEDDEWASWLAELDRERMARYAQEINDEPADPEVPDVS